MSEKNTSLSAFFREYTPDESMAFLFEGLKVLDIKADQKNREIHIEATSETVFPKEKIDALIEELKKTYLLSGLFIHMKYHPSLLTKEYYPSIVYHIKQKISCANGFLNQSNFELIEDKAILTLSHGGLALLKEQRLEKVVEDLLLSEFSTKILVECVESGEKSEDFRRKTDEKLKEIHEAVIANAKASAPAEKPQSPPTELPDGVIMGKSFSGELTPMQSIDETVRKVIVSGEVVDVRSAELKGGKYTSVIIDVTDFKSSVRAKRILDNQKAADLLRRIKKGMNVKVRGEMENDRFEKDFVLRPTDIVEVAKMKKQDSATEKRVELHLHTQMSAMDGMSSAEDLVRRAAEWGHKAVAITDHGVAQAFPDAMKAGKKNNIKILYGTEAYFINDTVPTVYGRKSEDFSGEFVVFDTETTGLSPATDKMTEIGAVRLRNGEMTEVFSTFVDPKMPIPEKITRLTGITDEMVKGAPETKEAIMLFKDFIGDAVLVAHNANFDMGFIRAAAACAEIEIKNTYLDTVTLCRFLYKDAKNHRLNTIAEYLKLPPFNHHRASDDAKMLSDIFKISLQKLEKEYHIENIDKINYISAGSSDYKKLRPYHQILLVKNEVGLKNLYKLISFAHLDYYYKRPRTLKSVLMQHREGLIVGSACDAGELYQAILEKRPEEEIEDIARFYDFLEIQPLGNTAHLVKSGQVENNEALREINKKIVLLGEKLKKPVVATGDVHFLDPKDEVFRRILMAGQGFSDADEQAPLYFKTTEEMLSEFSYLGEEKAYEVVIKNPNDIADLCEAISPVPGGFYPPEMENASEDIKRLTYEKAKKIYGDNLPKIISDRIEKELSSIINNGFSVMYMIAQKLVTKSLSDGYLVGSRGSVGSSLVAYLSGITEVNSLAPHYVCPKCKRSEFIDDPAYGCGADLPDKDCPDCHRPYKKDGFDIPFETFLGFDGDKTPDIDLNFSGDYQGKAHKYTEELFGEGYVFRAGTIGTVAEKTAFGFVKKYLADRETELSKAEENRLTLGCTGVKRTTGQHPGGIIVVPKHKEIYDFCPVQHPADDAGSDIITSHFDYHSIDQNLLKLDILGHDDPTVIRMLEDLTGVDAKTIPLDDKKTMSIFTSNEALSLSQDEIITDVGSLGIPEFGTRFVRGMLHDTQPKSFSDLVRISGLSHGTDVWLNNAKDLIRDKTATISDVISTRDDIMIYLIQKGMDKKLSFTIMEAVRKGKKLKPEWEEEMRKNNVPEWYIDSCNKIKYMFPKAHAVAYVTMAFRIAWFKVYYPLEYYATYFSVRADDFDAEIMIYGIDRVLTKIKEIDNNPAASKKEKDMIATLENCYEFYKRGFHFLNIDLYESDAEKFLVKDGAALPPLRAVAGLGTNAAQNVVKARADGEFMSWEDVRRRAGVSKTVVETLKQYGVAKDLTDTSQLTLFEL